MAQGKPTPLAEAIELMSEAARAYLDGPLAQLRAAAERAGQPNYDAQSATADAAGFYLQLARASGLAVGKALDATAILAEPPGDGYCYAVKVPAPSVACRVSVVKRAWTWAHDPEPAGIGIRVRPPGFLVPPNDTVLIDVTPSVLTGEPSWKVVLEIAPVPSGQPTTATVRLNDTTKVSTA